MGEIMAEQNNLKQNRIIGIDFLRSFSMMMVVMMHLLKQGGVLATVDGDNWTCYLMWLVEVICFCAVDCYALISGYVGCQSKFRPAKILMFWLQILFYTLLITIIFAICMPQSVNLKIWWKAIFPITSSQYWYMTSYFGLMLFMPFLNEGCNRMTTKSLRLIIGAMLLVFSVVPCILQGYPFNFDSGMNPYGLANGYSVLWLIVLYLCGAYIRKSNLCRKVRTWIVWILLAGAAILTWGCLFLVPILTMKRFGEVRYATILLDYTSPTVLGMAICFLLLFAKISSQAQRLIKIVKIWSAASLGVYLIHTHPLIWDYFMKDCMVGLCQGGILLLLLRLVAITVLIYAACTLVEFIRMGIFRILKAQRILERQTGKGKG